MRVKWWMQKIGVQCSIICSLDLDTNFASDDKAAKLSEVYEDKIYPITMSSADMIIDHNDNENYDEGEKEENYERAGKNEEEECEEYKKKNFTS